MRGASWGYMSVRLLLSVDYPEEMAAFTLLALKFCGKLFPCFPSYAFITC